MVDFRKLRKDTGQAISSDPIEIFRRLPKPEGINDLYNSQAHVLNEWFQRRAERDLVIKLHTGGGKTLVGLLIGLSILRETKMPVIYLCPTRQLVEQTINKANEYHIPAVVLPTEGLPREFLSASSVLVCTYKALFNGMSRFGVKGKGAFTEVGGIILDDAHVAGAIIRDAFTLQVSREKDPDAYGYLMTLFGNDFQEIGRGGTFNDIVKGDEKVAVMEVPYWAWVTRATQVQMYLGERSGMESYRFTWPLVRDILEHCHVLVSSDAVVFTPILPPIDMIPTFAECPRRIFMSATISDEASLIRTFDAQPDSLSKSITSRSLAGVSERMILAPDLMRFQPDNALEVIRRVIREVGESKRFDAGTLILVPSGKAASIWTDVAEYPNTTELVSEAVKQLQERSSRGPFVLAHRYDGIDLPGSACRLLIMAGLPRGVSAYDRYRASVLAGGAELAASQATRIEQGIGRGARGGADYCVVLLGGRDLIAWLGQVEHQRYLTTSTLAQFELGESVSHAVETEEMLLETVMQCITRAPEWVEYHAERLADLEEPATEDPLRVSQAGVEREVFRLLIDSRCNEAVEKLERFCAETTSLDPKSRGWLLQLAARVASVGGNSKQAQRLQRQAYAENSNLTRPNTQLSYVAASHPGPQAEAIARIIDGFNPRKAFLSNFEETVASKLTSTATSNQFEQALADLGWMLGFETQRPDHSFGVGPDVLWLLDDNLAFIMEAKSQKKPDNSMTKVEHGQLLNAEAWFKREYKDYRCVRICVHPNALASRSVVTDDTQALTLERLQALIGDARAFFMKVCDSTSPLPDFTSECSRGLSTSHLTPSDLQSRYLEPFTNAR